MSESNQSQTKVCKMCAETIKSAAVVCPHCRHVQTTWKLCNPNLSATLTLAFFFIAIIGGILFLNRIVGRQNFAPYQSQFAVLESTVSQRITSNAIFVVITGVLTNGSDYPWKNFALEGRLYGPASNLVDVIPASVEYYGGGGAVAAHSSAAFKIESRTSHALTDYADHKVSVQWAKDATAWP